MHVALVGDHPLPNQCSRGGVQRVVEVLRRELARTVRVTLLVPSSDVSLRHRDDYGEIVYLKRPPGPGFLNYWSLASIGLLKELKQLRPDIVHVQDVAGLSFSWGFRHGLECPVVFTAHGVLEADLLHASQGDTMRRLTAAVRAKVVEIVERRSRRLYDDIIVINGYVLEAMPDVVRHRHHFIPNPVDKIFFKAARHSVNSVTEYTLLQVGVICPRKNVLASIRIVSEMIKSGCVAHLKIIGPIKDQAYHLLCLDEIRKLRLEPFVTFHGSLAPVDVASQMDQADLLLLPSKQETAPMVIAEAHCRGLAVAGPRAFGLPSMVSEGENGVFLDGPTLKDDARRIVAFLATGVDRDKMRANARVKYELDKVVDLTLGVYKAARENRSTNVFPIAMAGE